MSLRYSLLTELLAVAGAFIVVVTFAFGGAATAIAFGVSIAVVIAAVAAIEEAPAAGRGLHRALGGLSAVIAAWTILVSLGIFSGATQRWLIFAGGAAVAALAVIARLVRDVQLERQLAVAEPGPSVVSIPTERPGAALSA